MKNIFLFITLFCIDYVIAQKKEVTISEEKFGMLETTYKKTIDLDKGDTTYRVFLSFQNPDYQTITDIKAFMLSTSVVYDEFIKNLKAAIPEIGAKTNVTWEKDNYTVMVYDFNKAVYLCESKKRGKACANISKKHAEKLLAWLESITFGKG